MGKGGGMSAVTVALSARGQVLYCPHGRVFHLEYGNVHLSLWIEHLQELWEMLETLEAGEAERMNAHTRFRRKILIPMRQSPANLLFTADEVAELRDLLGRAVDRAVLPQPARLEQEG
jgi:hypothetical protein